MAAILAPIFLLPAINQYLDLILSTCTKVMFFSAVRKSTSDWLAVEPMAVFPSELALTGAHPGTTFPLLSSSRPPHRLVLQLFTNRLIWPITGIDMVAFGRGLPCCPLSNVFEPPSSERNNQKTDGRMAASFYTLYRREEHKPI